ncbi:MULTISPECIES: hypothetical protein [unclassified Streptomyces]|uniref:hypothetical protein n=1 Tax=unclassified Streptomyces TaxID=2593676 RepID=UPI0033B899CB
MCDKATPPDTLCAVKSSLAYTASGAGQKALSRIGYAPLPESVAAEVRKVAGTHS